MQIGISFPQTEIGRDPIVIRDFVQAAEEMGFAHVSMPDHVLGEGTPRGPEFARLYTRDFMFHEPFALMGFLAGLTTTIELATAILILPQRQAVLVAKQAAEVDVLSGGRLRLGVGLGWNEVEFDALGMDFRNRGHRMEEQIAVMRRLWCQDLVTFEGEWHNFADAGLNPEPVQRPIPVWIGAMSEPAVRRTGRIADGWFVYARAEPDDEVRGYFDLLRDSATEAGRDPAEIGVDATVYAHTGGPQEWLDLIERWQALGATRVTFRTTESGLDCPDGQLDAMRRLMDAR